MVCILILLAAGGSTWALQPGRCSRAGRVGVLFTPDFCTHLNPAQPDSVRADAS